MLQSHTNPQIDEAIWQAWVENNKAKDKFRFARRLRVIALVMALLAVSALLWRFTGSVTHLTETRYIQVFQSKEVIP